MNPKTKLKIEEMFWGEFDRRQQAAEKHRRRWLDKFHGLTKEQRLEIVKKIIQKYESDEYIDREYGKGYEPRTELYYWLMMYAARHGKITDYRMQSYFPEEAYMFDDKIFVSAMYGQGTIYTVKIL